MGDLRRVGEILQHNTAMRGEPENWVTIKFDEAGTPFEVHDAHDAVLDADTGRIIMAVGGVRISMTPETAATVTAGFAKHVPDAKAQEVDAAIAVQDARLADELAQRRAEIDAETAAHIAEKQAQLDELTAQIEAKQAEVDAQAIAPFGAADGLLSGKDGG